MAHIPIYRYHRTKSNHQYVHLLLLNQSSFSFYRNIPIICRSNFSIAKVGSATDKGYYGAGVYFSEKSAVSSGYARDSKQMFICQLLLGKEYPHTAQHK